MDKTELLFQMMEQPDKYTHEQWQDILADEECRELYMLMSKTKSAIDASHADEDITDEMIDAEWQQLKTRHHYFQFRKFAAMFVGILMLSGIAFAAIHIVTYDNTPKEQNIVVEANSHLSTADPQPVENDTIATPRPKLYDNVPLGVIFKELSDYYHVKVVYRNEDAPQLRLFYQRKPEYSLEKVVEMLNNFEWLQLELENDTLYVSSTVEPQP